MKTWTINLTSCGYRNRQARRGLVHSPLAQAFDRIEMDAYRRKRVIDIYRQLRKAGVPDYKCRSIIASLYESGYNDGATQNFGTRETYRFYPNPPVEVTA